MKLIAKGEDGAEPVHMSWDAGLAALASGAYEPVPLDGARDIDQPGAQTPAPGTDPKDGEETAAEGHVLTNMTPVAASGVVSDGLPKSPAPSEPAPAKAPTAAAPAPQPQVVAVPVAAKSA